MNTVGLGHKILYFLKEADNLVNGRFQMPVCFEIDASNHCQNNCDFCMFAFYIKKNRVHFPVHIYYKLLWEFKRMGVNAFTFTGGGEPLMHPNIRSMIQATETVGLQVGLVTNGIDLDCVMDLTESFEYVRVSLDAACDETYRKTKHTNHFYDILDNIKELVDLNVTDVGISFVITDENRDEIDAFHDLAKSLGVHYAQIKPEIKPCDMYAQTKDVDRDKFFVTERYNIDHESMTACKLAGLIGVVNATGEIYYCCVHRGRKQFVIGDLNKDSLITIYNEYRPAYKPDKKRCIGSCRYMNYGKIYEQVEGKQYAILRHRDFI
jgi:MoaA/NifB/PqqE/SkfB family radical SAM enzyme